MGLVARDDGWRIPDEVWAQMERLLPPRPPHPLGCHNPRVPDRNAMNAILLVLRTGIQWNALSATGICSCSSAYRRFREWAEAGVFPSSGSEGCSPMTIRRGSSGSGWPWTAPSARRRLEATRRGRIPLTELTGAKRSLLTEGQGVPLGIEPAGANLNDFKLARATIESIPIERPEPSAERPQGLCLDKGYDFPEVYQLAAEFGFTAHIRSRGEEAEALRREAGFRARRWVVERTQSWLNRFRRLLVRWEKRADTYLAMLHLACA
jgi:putative transposase